ncbi:NUDIX hydrolase [Paenibacillus puldeungensis]|uniref:NUDIX hydrolase n=1 Tax=Paenibacillus puldeungensis TaxID=696536 RepID=A0ABW3RZM0_9BACL
MISFTQDRDKFNFRVVGIVIHNDRILLHTTLKDDFWTLPGGRVEFQESTDKTLVREIKEELDIDIKIDRLIFINEDFFEYDDLNYHEIGFYYLFSFPEGHEIVGMNGEFNGIEDGGRLIFKWFHIQELQNIEVYPERLKEDLKDLSQTNIIKHYIEYQ